MDRCVITEQWGGLGDALAYSTLPEMFHSHFGKATYISNFYKPRNAEIAKLVWGENPFVLGWTSEKPNAGSVVPYVWTSDQSFIQNVEASHGLPALSTRPKVYLRPRRDRSLGNRFLIDISTTTLSRGPFGLRAEVLENKVAELIANYGETRFLFMQLSNLRRIDSHSLGVSMPLEEKFPNIARLKIGNLFEYADALASAKGFVGLHSGGVALASAIKEFNEELDIECLISPSLAVHPRQTVERIHNYPDVRYTAVT